MFMDENLSSRPKALSQMQDPILYVGKFEHELTKLIHDYGDYLYMVFAWSCLFFIAWLVFRKRKSPSLGHASVGSRAIVEIMLTSPGASSDAHGGRTVGGDPSRN